MNNKIDERLAEMMDRDSKYKCEVLEEWKLTRDGWLPLYLRKFNKHGKEYWEMSYNKDHYGRLWGRLDGYFTEEIIRDGIESNDGVLYKDECSDGWYK